MLRFESKFLFTISCVPNIAGRSTNSVHVHSNQVHHLAARFRRNLICVFTKFTYFFPNILGYCRN